jgi:hypothetical protein
MRASVRAGNEFDFSYCANHGIGDFVDAPLLHPHGGRIHLHEGGSMAKKAARKSAKKSSAKKSAKKSARKSAKKSSAKKGMKRSSAKKSSKKSSRR